MLQRLVDENWGYTYDLGHLHYGFLWDFNRSHEIAKFLRDVKVNSMIILHGEIRNLASQIHGVNFQAANIKGEAFGSSDRDNRTIPNCDQLVQLSENRTIHSPVEYFQQMLETIRTGMGNHQHIL